MIITVTTTARTIFFIKSPLLLSIFMSSSSGIPSVSRINGSSSVTFSWLIFLPISLFSFSIVSCLLIVSFLVSLYVFPETIKSWNIVLLLPDLPSFIVYI